MRGGSKRRLIVRIAVVAVALASLLLGAAQSGSAHAQADFFRGKTISMLIGYTSGGGYDLYARVLSRHMGRHIPGNPNLVVQNMPGGGGIRAANFLYGAAPKDGTTLGTFSRDMPLLAVMGTNSAVQFDPRKFAWLGSSSSFADD